MGFLQPLGLLALAAVAIPPLLHLLGRRRPAAVVFPAVQYLSDTTREHSRRLRIRHRLLLALRMLILGLIGLAAARPVARTVGGAVHPPTALAVVVDNSLSSGAVAAGRETLDRLVVRARDVLGRTASGDELWLVLADGLPRRVTRAEAEATLATIEPEPVRLDVSDAVRAVARTVAEAAAPTRRIVVLSDLQATAFTSGDTVPIPVVALAPAAAPGNRSIDGAEADPVVWSPRGTVVATLGGTLAGDADVRLLVDGRERGHAVATAGSTVSLAAMAPTGWNILEVRSSADELRADDSWWLAVRGAPVLAARAEAGAGPFVERAFGVLVDGGRAQAGDDVVLADRLASGPTVLFPPADPALVNALNQSLAARGVTVRYGARVDGEWTIGGAGPADGATVTRRQRVSGGTPVATVANEPWLVRDGSLLVVGSRMEPAWTGLPVSAAFVPFLDFLLHRVGTQQVDVVDGTPGAPVTLPPGARTMFVGSSAVPVGDASASAPPEAGVYFVAGAHGDTIGVLQVNHDPRESRLAPATPAAIRAALGSAVRIVDQSDLGPAVFGGVGRAELTPLLLAIAVALLVVELAVSTWGAKRSP